MLLVRKLSKFNGDEFTKIMYKRKQCYPNSFLYIYILFSYFTLSWADKKFSRLDVFLKGVASKVKETA